MELTSSNNLDIAGCRCVMSQCISASRAVCDGLDTSCCARNSERQCCCTSRREGSSADGQASAGLSQANSGLRRYTDDSIVVLAVSDIHIAVCCGAWHSEGACTD